MLQPEPEWPEVFTVGEIARVADVSADEVRDLLHLMDSEPGRQFISFDEAVRLVRSLRAARSGHVLPRSLFAPPHPTRHTGRVPLATSGAIHLALLAAILIAASLGVPSAVTDVEARDTPRLVFLSAPGPGGGGGGGGLEQRRRASQAELRGTSKLRSPVTVTRNVDRREPEKRVETPPPAAPTPTPDPEPPAPIPQPTPPVSAPVVSVPSGEADRPGVIEADSATESSHGSGRGGGTGTGEGTGSGPGEGAGIGGGSGAGIGGGPYRAGAGITPPGLLREVKPVYTEEGRRRGVEGEVVLEVVIRSDGSVGAIRVVTGLGSGLDQRAVDAVRQWRFTPGRRYGTPVDVLVEVAVEFRMR